MTPCIKCGEWFAGSFTGECKACESDSIANWIIQNQNKPFTKCKNCRHEFDMNTAKAVEDKDWLVEYPSCGQSN